MKKSFLILIIVVLFILTSCSGEKTDYPSEQKNATKSRVELEEGELEGTLIISIVFEHDIEEKIAGFKALHPKVEILFTDYSKDILKYYEQTATKLDRV